MYKDKKIVAFVPAKGSSERLSNKNSRIIHGKPLYYHAIDKLLQCDIIDVVVLDSDDQNILSTYDYLPYEKMVRNKDLANNNTDGNKLLMNEIKRYDADVYVQLLCTAPLIKVETIVDGIKNVIDSEEFDSAVATNKSQLYTWTNNHPDYNISEIPNSKDLPYTISENMSLYIIEKESAIKNKKRIGDKPLLLTLDNIESIDIDNEDDFNTARYIMLGKSMDEVSNLNKLKCVLTSELLSDALSEMGYYNQVINLKTNLKNNKSMGRAKTLKIKAIEDNHPSEIYDTMKYYDYMCPNDILCIENNLPAAFFGEINAMVSMSEGVSAAIVSGITRDIREVTAMNFPVYYKENICTDVKFKGVLDYYDKPICIHGVKISSDDLIFCDHEGVIVIPRSLEEKVINAALEAYHNEKNIVYDFASGFNIIDRKF